MNVALMAPQVAEAVEVEAAERAAMGAVTLLNAFMAFQKMQVAEGSQALTAYVGRGGQLLELRAVWVGSL